HRCFFHSVLFLQRGFHFPRLHSQPSRHLHPPIFSSTEFQRPVPSPPAQLSRPIHPLSTFTRIRIRNKSRYAVFLLLCPYIALRYSLSCDINLSQLSFSHCLHLPVQQIQPHSSSHMLHLHYSRTLLLSRSSKLSQPVQQASPSRFAVPIHSIHSLRDLFSQLLLQFVQQLHPLLTHHSLDSLQPPRKFSRYCLQLLCSRPPHRHSFIPQHPRYLPRHHLLSSASSNTHHTRAPPQSPHDLYSPYFSSSLPNRDTILFSYP